MESMLRKIGIKRHEPRETEARLKIQKELFRFQNITSYGFPHKSSSIAYYPFFDVLLLGTEDGYLYVYGDVGEMICLQHPSECPLVSIMPLSEGNIITYDGFSSLYWWKLCATSNTHHNNNHNCENKNNNNDNNNNENNKNNNSFFLTSEDSPFFTAPSTSSLSCFCVSEDYKFVAMATDDTSLILLSLDEYLSFFSCSGSSSPPPPLFVKVSKEIILQNYYEDTKDNLGSIVGIQQVESKTLLLCFSKGVICLLNTLTNSSLKHFTSIQPIESLCVLSNKKKFITSHSNGCYMTWSFNKNNPHSLVPYGPDNCKPITKLQHLSSSSLFSSSPTNRKKNSYKRTKDVEVKDGGSEEEEEEEEEDGMIIFSGGLPSFTLGDKYAISIFHGNRNVALELSSKIIDFISLGKEKMILIILTTEEIVAVDLSCYSFSCFMMPYLGCLHGSAITCFDVLDSVNDEVFQLLGKQQPKQLRDNFSNKSWPIKGVLTPSSSKNSSLKNRLLITGHEDGSVRMWNVTQASQCVEINRFNTCVMYDTYFNSEEEEEEEGRGDREIKMDIWSNLKRIGFYDPYSDDPRFCVKKVKFFPNQLVLLTAGAAGQAAVWKVDCWNEQEKFPKEKKQQTVQELHRELNKQQLLTQLSEEIHKIKEETKSNPMNKTLNIKLKEKQKLQFQLQEELEKLPSHSKQRKQTYKSLNLLDMRPVRIHLIDEKDPFFSWKGQEMLNLKQGVLKIKGLFEPICLVQIFPPSSCTAADLQPQWQLMSIGTGHGFGLVDYHQKRFVEVKATLNPLDSNMGNESGVSRRKSFKKSLRESFRRLRSRRKSKTTIQMNTNSPSKPATMTTEVIDLEAPKPVERAVEARKPDDASNSIVRVLLFANTFITSAQSLSPSLWAGTNGGKIYVYHINIPLLRNQDDVVSCLAKEIHLKHHAPIMNIELIEKSLSDNSHKPISTNERMDYNDTCPNSTNHQQKMSELHSISHSATICSEEQIKIFSLPNLRPLEKYKLTALEGCKLRRGALASFSSLDSSLLETCLCCMTNQGTCHIFSLPQLRLQLKHQALKKDNIMGITSSIIKENGDVFYLKSSSQLTHFTLAANHLSSKKITFKQSVD